MKKVYVAYGFDIGSHTLIGVSETQEGIDNLTYQYKVDRLGYHPFVNVREVELDSLCFTKLSK